MYAYYENSQIAIEKNTSTMVKVQTKITFFFSARSPSQPLLNNTVVHGKDSNTSGALKCSRRTSEQKRRNPLRHLPSFMEAVIVSLTRASRLLQSAKKVKNGPHLSSEKPPPVIFFISAQSKQSTKFF